MINLKKVYQAFLFFHTLSLNLLLHPHFLIKNGGEAVNLELPFFRITVIIYVRTKIFKVVI